jgi:hypothetical protein
MVTVMPSGVMTMSLARKPKGAHLQRPQADQVRQAAGLQSVSEYQTDVIIHSSL